MFQNADAIAAATATATATSTATASSDGEHGSADDVCAMGLYISVWAFGHYIISNVSDKRACNKNKENEEKEAEKERGKLMFLIFIV